MNRAAIEPRPTLDELFGPEPEALIATMEANVAEMRAVKAEADAIRAEVEAIKAEAEGSPLLVPGLAERYAELAERYAELADESVGRVRRSRELAELAEERAREQELWCSHRFFLGPIELYPTARAAYGVKIAETPSGRLFSHYHHWAAALWCAAEDAALLGMEDARAALEAMGCSAERAARRCREAIDAARASLARMGRIPASRPEPARSARGLIGELLAPAVLAAGGDLGAFVARC